MSVRENRYTCTLDKNLDLAKLDCRTRKREREREREGEKRGKVHLIFVDDSFIISIIGIYKARKNDF